MQRQPAGLCGGDASDPSTCSASSKPVPFRGDVLMAWMMSLYGARTPRGPREVVAPLRRSGLHYAPSGEVTERPKVQHWKCCVLQKGTVGSNPTLSAMFYQLFDFP